MEPTKTNLSNVSTTQPCPICGHTDWCAVSDDGLKIICRRTQSGSIKIGEDASGIPYYVHLTEAGREKYQSRIEQDRVALETIPPASREFTHQFFTDLLNNLSLFDNHRESLHKRGLNEAEINRLGYRSWPDIPPWKLAKSLREKYGDHILSIPGFYLAESKKGKKYVNLNYRPGFIIPSRDTEGFIQSLITRSDTGTPKYIQLTSKKRGGYAPEYGCHFPLNNFSRETIRITEGVLKSDIATSLSGIFTLGLQGLSWKNSLPILLSINPQKIIIAFDADSSKNIHVAVSLEKFIAALREQLPNSSICLEIWPIEWGKGIDDVLLNGYTTTILENRERIDSEIARIIESAKEYREKPKNENDPEAVIEELNKYHAIVSIGSNVVILRERTGTNHQISVDFLRKPDFQTLLENKTVTLRDENGNPKEKPAAKYWLTHPNRREYEQVVFDPSVNPGSNHSTTNYNLWRGFAIQPAAGDWSLYRNHIQENICSGDESLFQYILAWMADAVQNLCDRPGVAIVLRGKEGTGKGIFCREFGALFGQHFTHISQSKHLTGNFNAHLKDCLLLFADEAFWAGDKSGEGVLKALITEPQLLIEMKGRDPLLMDNHVRLIIASNNEWVIPAGAEARRFCMIDVGNRHIQDTTYFQNIIEQMNNGGREALFYDLLHHDLSKINLRNVPQTSSLFDQKIISMNPVEQFWFEILSAGKFYPNDESWRTQMQKDQLYELYEKTSGKAGINRRGFEIHLSSQLRNHLCPSLREQRLTYPVYDENNQYVSSIRKRTWLIPELDVCRREFSQHLNSTIDWLIDDIDELDTCAELRDEDRKNVENRNENGLLPF